MRIKDIISPKDFLDLKEKEREMADKEKDQEESPLSLYWRIEKSRERLLEGSLLQRQMKEFVDIGKRGRKEIGVRWKRKDGNMENSSQDVVLDPEVLNEKSFPLSPEIIDSLVGETLIQTYLIDVDSKQRGIQLSPRDQVGQEVIKAFDTYGSIAHYKRKFPYGQDYLFSHLERWREKNDFDQIWDNASSLLNIPDPSLQEEVLLSILTGYLFYGGVYPEGVDPHIVDTLLNIAEEVQKFHGGPVEKGEVEKPLKYNQLLNQFRSLLKRIPQNNSQNGQSLEGKDLKDLEGKDPPVGVGRGPWGAGKEGLSKRDIEIMKEMEEGEAQDISEEVKGILGSYYPGGVVISNAEEGPIPSDYDPSLKRILQKLTKNKSRFLMAQKEGLISDSSLYRGEFRDDVFRKKSDKDVPNLCIGLLLDHSGSVQGQWDQSIIPIAESFFRSIQNGLDLYILSYTDPGTNMKFLFKPGWRGLRTNPGDFGGTPSGLGLAVMQTIMKRSKKRKKILFHVTDGGPNSTQEVQISEKALEKEGISCLTLLVQGHGEGIYKNYENVTSMNELGSVVSKLFDQMVKS